MSDMAPKLRRLAVDAARDKLNAKTKTRREVNIAEMHAYCIALELAVKELPTEGIAIGVGFRDDSGRQEIIRFLGAHNARRLGFGEAAP